MEIQKCIGCEQDIAWTDEFVMFFSVWVCMKCIAKLSTEALLKLIEERWRRDDDKIA